MEWTPERRAQQAEWAQDYLGRHTGAGDFFIVGEKRTRNPDFKKHGENKVVEIYGKYWHRAERGLEHETIQWYREAGFECIIVWEDEVERLEELVV